MWKLKEDLFKMATESKGEVMIMEMAQHVSSWLQIQQRNKTSYSSFYEEMEARR